MATFAGLWLNLIGVGLALVRVCMISDLLFVVVESWGPSEPIYGTWDPRNLL